jgi:alkanesulfonate monooxygenase SsuD/methylene tetrahydromethanopterin reductase-like flavin-dependent oxidoreductase (luciferase family)
VGGASGVGKTDWFESGARVVPCQVTGPPAYQRFSTLQGLSNGRAEVILGRGSFTESFPLFGYREEPELLLEQGLVLVEGVAEEREGFGERAAAEDLGAAGRRAGDLAGHHPGAALEPVRLPHPGGAAHDLR